MSVWLSCLARMWGVFVHPFSVLVCVLASSSLLLSSAATVAAAGTSGASAGAGYYRVVTATTGLSR